MNHLPNLYQTVISRTDGRCQCSGACGKKHNTEDSSCRHRDQNGQRLAVVPADPNIPERESHGLPAAQMIALCKDCLGPHRSKARKARAAKLAEQLAEAQLELF